MDLLYLIVLIIVVLAILGIFFAGFVSASPGEIKVISGPRGQRVLHGKTGWKIPILERVDTMTAGMISVDARTSDYVPTNDYINVKVDAAVKVKIGTERPELFQAATRNFLYKTSDEIADEVRDTLEGHLRAIIGQMKLAQIVTDRVSFSEKVQENATKDLEEMGLEIVAFNIQGLIDDKGVIENLGIDNTEQIRKEAAKAKAKAQQEIAQQQAESDKLANEARVAADLEIAQKQNELAKRQAALQAEADTERAKADAAYAIQQEIQRKEIERETAEANIVKQEKEAEVKTHEVEVRKQQLAADIKAQADADKYARQQAAEADRLERQAKADAELYETQKEADARKAQAEAEKFAQLQEAEAIAAKGKAEAEAIRLKLEAEAKGLLQKAEAMKQMQDAAITEMVVNVLPEIAKNVAAPLTNVDSITMYGDGNSAKMVGDIMNTMSQVTEGMGIDIKELITATLTGRAAGRAIAENTEEQA
ncbi:flotillin family protein [Streptococcus cuniculi]|uniref:Flotillin family protein n=1 Tax=Streptococcus cuniculi TaxID=1432788 RepID=A0A1Q8E9I2_9STRE|nr:flotillin family protein [Streptococcus cuniculi]OLF48441.1 flotillin family protein [Streptococcus cuniculi]